MPLSSNAIGSRSASASFAKRRVDAYRQLVRPAVVIEEVADVHGERRVAALVEDRQCSGAVCWTDQEVEIVEYSQPQVSVVLVRQWKPLQYERRYSVVLQQLVEIAKL